MRKVFLAIVGAFIALFGLFGVQVHLVKDVNEIGVVAGLLVVGVYIFVEFRKDWADFMAGVKQTNQWGDPAFWTALITSVALPLLTSFGLKLTPEAISIAAAILSVVVPILMSIFRKKEPDPVALAFRGIKT